MTIQFANGVQPFPDEKWNECLIKMVQDALKRPDSPLLHVDGKIILRRTVHAGARITITIMRKFQQSKQFILNRIRDDLYEIAPTD